MGAAYMVESGCVRVGWLWVWNLKIYGPCSSGSWEMWRIHVVGNWHRNDMKRTLGEWVCVVDLRLRLSISKYAYEMVYRSAQEWRFPNDIVLRITWKDFLKSELAFLCQLPEKEWSVLIYRDMPLLHSVLTQNCLRSRVSKKWGSETFA